MGGCQVVAMQLQGGCECLPGCFFMVAIGLWVIARAVLWRYGWLSECLYLVSMWLWVIARECM